MSLTPFGMTPFVIPSIPRSMFDMDLWHRPINMDLLRRNLDFGPSTLGNFLFNMKKFLFLFLFLFL